ncbi:TetR/AcrR family transcriptional regulator [Salinibacterium sp. ZJ454]|uniref:TetR/AcrR family transcriptional regulator n=1 Tax=Salinibacterium sp. ZJ454 TaxID=2708339 RepID=UPI00141F14BC|nr:TetR/AcrR family transcriptional regulator [Salinibacterium sp. ZJ454]
MNGTTVATPQTTARERIIRSAYELFSHRSIRDVGVDELIQSAGVATSTFYRHFPSKDDVVIAFLERRETIWTYGTIEAEARRRGTTAREQLLAIFDIYDEWFRRDDYEACSFMHVLFEMGSEHPLGRASIDNLGRIRQVVRMFATEAGLHRVDDFDWSWHILMKGAIVAAEEGDKDAALRAKRMGAWLIDQHSA